MFCGRLRGVFLFSRFLDNRPNRRAPARCIPLPKRCTPLAQTSIDVVTAVRMPRPVAVKAGHAVPDKRKHRPIEVGIQRIPHLQVQVFAAVQRHGRREKFFRRACAPGKKNRRLSTFHIDYRNHLPGCDIDAPPAAGHNPVFPVHASFYSHHSGVSSPSATILSFS